MPWRAKIPLFLTPAFVFLSLALVSWLQIREARVKDFHWTPSTHPLSLEEAAGNARVLVDGRAAESLLERGELGVLREGAWIPLGKEDVALRINHMHRVNGTRLFTLGLFLALGAAHLVLFFLPVRFGRDGP